MARGIKKGQYRKPRDRKSDCLQRNAGKPFLSRGCTLPTVMNRKRKKTTKITKKTKIIKKRKKK